MIARRIVRPAETVPRRPGLADYVPVSTDFPRWLLRWLARLEWPLMNSVVDFLPHRLPCGSSRKSPMSCRRVGLRPRVASPGRLVFPGTFPDDPVVPGCPGRVVGPGRRDSCGQRPSLRQRRPNVAHRRVGAVRPQARRGRTRSSRRMRACWDAWAGHQNEGEVLADGRGRVWFCHSGRRRRAPPRIRRPHRREGWAKRTVVYLLFDRVRNVRAHGGAAMIWNIVLKWNPNEK